MFQQAIAIIIILYFVVRIVTQKHKKQITKNEFLLWLIFWFFVMFAIVFIKYIDTFVANLGFSAAGIEVLLYLAVAWLIYAFFKLRIKLEKQEQIITKIIRHISLKE